VNTCPQMIVITKEPLPDDSFTVILQKPVLGLADGSQEPRHIKT
jgi:hypothetical protein